MCVDQISDSMGNWQENTKVFFPNSLNTTCKEQGWTVGNYHDPCLHPSVESSGLLNRQIKPACSGR